MAFMLDTVARFDSAEEAFAVAKLAEKKYNIFTSIYIEERQHGKVWCVGIRRERRDSRNVVQQAELARSFIECIVEAIVLSPGPGRG